MAKVLITDDDMTIRELFKYVFLDAGHEILEASNGREALGLLAAETPEFMVLDVSMPEMTGSEFIQALSRLALREPRLKGIPFVVMTGENYLEAELNRVFATVQGFVCFFPKMTPPEKVLETAEAVMRSRR